MDELICDFCSEVTGKSGETFQCQDFNMAVAEDFPLDVDGEIVTLDTFTLNSVGQWNACPTCAALVHASDRNGLLERVLAQMADRYDLSGDFKPVLRKYLETTYDKFFSLMVR